MSILVATESNVFAMDTDRAAMIAGRGIESRPTCLAADPLSPGRVWCGTGGGGVFRSDDAGATWTGTGLRDEQIMAIAASPSETGVVWVGTEPSQVWVSRGGGAWERTHDLAELPSSSQWSFPPKPHSHHVRWIACHPAEPGRLWVAIEAGALVSTRDGGNTWRDRVAGGPWDTHELAVHAAAPDTLRVAAGDGYFESHDGGDTWSSPSKGLEVGYLRSVALDPGRPDVVIVSASSGPRTAYVAGVSDGRLFRRAGQGRWERVREGWPVKPSTIAPLLVAGAGNGELWAADERGVHRSDDGGVTWLMVAEYSTAPHHLRGLALVTGRGGEADTR
jgi:photosystem II stability/assembly factor-like uncharacterized protein